MNSRWRFVACIALALGCGPEFDLDSLPRNPIDAEQIAGIWEGRIEAADLRIVIRVSASEQGLVAELDSPDQGVLGIGADDARFDGRRFALAIESIGATYHAAMNDAGALEGEWNQGIGVDLTLVKVDAPSERVREQTPKPPFPYREEDAVFPGGAPASSSRGRSPSRQPKTSPPWCS